MLKRGILDIFTVDMSEYFITLVTVITLEIKQLQVMSF